MKKKKVSKKTEDIIKIFAFTDSHGSIDALRKIKSKITKENKKSKNKLSAVLCCGDFSVFEQAMTKLLKKINALGVKVLLIQGNHECSLTLNKVIRKRKLKNIKFIHKSSYRIGNFVILGYGGGGFSLRDKEFLKWSKKEFRKLKKNDKVIMMFHGPPYKTNLDRLLDDYCGNRDYRKVIKANSKRIKLVLAGHIHECFGETDRIKHTILVNPGPYGAMFEID